MGWGDKGWQQVEVMDTAPVEINETEEVRVMDEEPVLSTGEPLW